MKDLRELGRYPEQGPSIEALTGFQTELRMLLCGKHIALYKIENEAVFVARVIDARQDYLRVLFGEDCGESENASVSHDNHREEQAKSLFGSIPGNETIEHAREERREKI